MRKRLGLIIQALLVTSNNGKKRWPFPDPTEQDLDFECNTDTDIPTLASFTVEKCLHGDGEGDIEFEAKLLSTDGKVASYSIALVTFTPY